MFGTLGTQEILLIVGLFVLLFGAGSIPKLARSLGKAKGEFKRAQKEMENEARKGEEEAQRKAEEEKKRAGGLTRSPVTGTASEGGSPSGRP